MQELVAVIFKGKTQAQDIMSYLAGVKFSYLAGVKFSYLMDIEDSCLLVFDELDHVDLQRSLPLALPGLKEIAYWKVLADCILPERYSIPLKMTDQVALDKLELEQAFIQQLHSHLKSDSSALLIRVKNQLPRRIERILVRFEGTILSTPFGERNEAQINAALLASRH